MSTPEPTLRDLATQLGHLATQLGEFRTESSARFDRLEGAVSRIAIEIMSLHTRLGLKRTSMRDSPRSTDTSTTSTVGWRRSSRSTSP